jgi:5-methylcytosine-specific restriction endonuclease McrA
MRGKGNSHFKDGTSYATWFREMRPIILERDRHACVACKKTEKLIVHHVDHVPWHNESHNLITLCATCHAVHHKSKVSPFPWLKKLALWQSMSYRLKLKSIKLEAKYFPGI